MDSGSKPQPFIGVCGVQTARELDTLEEITKHMLSDTGYFLMAGIKDPAKITTTPARHSHVRPFIHCDFQPGVSFEAALYERLAATRLYARGFQLNCMPWLDTDFSALLTDIKRQYPNIAIMLQVHNKMMQSFTPQQVAERAKQLPIDYLFFDPSQSRGIPYDVAVMKEFVDAAYPVVPAVVVAGGLGPHTITDHFGPLVAAYPRLSCDAFGKLQDANTGMFDWTAVRSYLQAWKTSVAPGSAEE